MTLVFKLQGHGVILLMVFFSFVLFYAAMYKN